MEPKQKIRKYNSLSLEEKRKIIANHEAGMKLSQLCEEYQVPRSTVQHILKTKDKIKDACVKIERLQGNCASRKHIGKSVDDELDHAVFKWVCQKKEIGVPVSGKLLQQKAREFYTELHSNDSNKKKLFKASQGWLDKFKKRHGLRYLQEKGEKLSADSQSSTDSVDPFCCFVEQHHYPMENIYNADEFGLQYKSLPKKTLVLPNEKEVPGHKPVKERITVMVCANASGTDKIPLLAIGKDQKPRCFNRVDKPPVQLEAQSSADQSFSKFLVMEPKQKIRKYNSLSLEEKRKIIANHEAGMKLSQLCEEYQVPRSTVQHILKTKDKIKDACVKIERLQGNCASRKHIGKSVDDELDHAVFKWVCQKKEIGVPVSGKLLQQKAREFYTELHSNDSNKKNLFKASQGWLDKFKKRHGLRYLQEKGAKLSADSQSSTDFVHPFCCFVEQHHFPLENIYNADEFGLQYKSLPKKTLVLPNEKEVPGHKSVKERITVMVCANASGTDKIPLLAIGKYQKPRCFNCVDKPPVQYEAQSSAWMSEDIFRRWFTNVFVPHVTQRDPNGRFILLLDNAPAHPSADELNLIDERVLVQYLPTNCTSLIQPMDQGVICAIKKHYMREYLYRLLSHGHSSHEEVLKFYKGWSLLDCLKILKAAWDEVSTSTLANAWKKLIPSHVTNVFEHALRNESSRSVTYGDIAALLNKIPGGDACSVQEAQQWLDEKLQVFRVLTDAELLNRCRNSQSTGTLETSDNNFEEEPENQYENTDPGPSAKEALDAVLKIFKWSEKHHKFSPEDFRVFTKWRNETLHCAYNI